MYLDQVLPLAASAFFISAVNAQVPLFGQCGGQGYTGSTTCAPGAVCQSQNAFFFQCVQNTATATPVSTTKAPSVITSKSTTISTVSTKTAQAVTTTAPATAKSSGTKYLMIFGDSYSSDGFWAGSDTPSAAEPLGVFQGGSTTDGGLNWVGVTATQLNSSLTLAFDFAEYGATTDNSLVNGATEDFIGQVGVFQTYTAHNASNIAWNSENTMAIVWMGINDVGNAYWDGFSTPLTSVQDKYFQQLQILYNAGIRYFTLFMVPPFDQAPAFAQQSAQSLTFLRANITAYNQNLVTRMASFKSSNSGTIGTVFNTSDSFWTVLKSPSTFGAPDATCQNADGTSCLWFDNYHPGQAIQKLVAQNFVKALTGIFF